MYMVERRREILKYLNDNQRASVDYFSQLFRVSKETIRTDLNVLSKAGYILRCHGGAILARRNLQSELISENSKGFENIMDSQVLRDHKAVQNTDSSYIGKVCIFGSFNVDIVAKVARFPRSGESVMALESKIGPGGKGANQAAAASRAGAKVHFVAKVGKDQFSQMAHDHLTASDIFSFNLYQSESEPTGNAIIYVSEDKGENMIAIHSGANMTVTRNEIQGIISELSTSDVLLVQLETNIDATLALLNIAKEMNKAVIINPAPYSSDILQCLPYCDIITPNETEASQLSGIEVNSIESAMEAALKISSYGVPNVIITMGSKGAVLYAEEKFTQIPSFPAVVADTTGAGDAFNGALAASIASGKNLQNSASWASAFASLAVELEGASNMPEIEQVNARFNKEIKKHKKN